MEKLKNDFNKWNTTFMREKGKRIWIQNGANEQSWMEGRVACNWGCATL
jgi:hypothetical protein